MSLVLFAPDLSEFVGRHTTTLRGVTLPCVIPVLRSSVTIGNVRAMDESPAQIIEAKGGAAAVASAVGRKPGAVRAWKSRNILPREAWPEIMTAYPDLTLERLIKIESNGARKNPTDKDEVA